MARKSRKNSLPKTKSPEEWRSFFAAINTRYDSGCRAHALFYLQYQSGLRIGEALQLSVKDVDLDLLKVHVRVGKTGARVVPLPEDPMLARSINRWLEVRARWNPDSDLLFVTRTGMPLSSNSARETMKVVAERAGIGHTSCHQLRHSLATELLSQGASPIGVQRILGHRLLSTTLTVYAHAADTHAREAMNHR